VCVGVHVCGGRGENSGHCIKAKDCCISNVDNFGDNARTWH
jgi:hypothetical protein